MKLLYQGALFMVSMLLAALVGLAASLPAAAEHDPNRLTLSHYADGDPTQSDMEHLGCESANQARNGAMYLWFGSAVSVDGAYGASMWGHPHTQVQVRNLVRAFARDYDRCASGSTFVRVAVGVSNCLMGSGASDSQCENTAAYKTDAWVKAHGLAWGTMVDDLNTWATNNGHADRLAFMGGLDLEPEYSGFARPDKWLEGFDSAGSTQLYVAFYAGACPSYAAEGNCANGWTLHQVWRLSWGYAPSLAFPQIYNQGWGGQTQSVSEHGYHNDNFANINFSGAMSSQAYNTQHQAALWLLNALNSHNHTAQSGVSFTTEQRNLTAGLHDH